MAEKQQYKKRCNQGCNHYLPNPSRCQLMGFEVKENQLCTNINSLYDIVKDLEDNAQSPPSRKTYTVSRALTPEGVEEAISRTTEHSLRQALALGDSKKVPAQIPPSRTEPKIIRRPGFSIFL